MPTPCFEEGQRVRQKWYDGLRHYDYMAKRPYEEKVAHALDLTKDTLKEFGDDTAISCSFGKDSMVILHMALRHHQKIKVMFADTLCEYKETYKYRDYMLPLWKLNYYEARPEKGVNFWTCKNQYGYPRTRFLSKSKKKDWSLDGTPKCCLYLKEKPLMKVQKELSVNAVILGLSAKESYNRRWTVIRYGDHYDTKHHAPYLTRRVLPLAYFTVDDVWRYIRENNIPSNPMYALIPRVGCRFCTGHLNWQEEIGKTNPFMLKFILDDMEKRGELP